jgi:DNA modification methylase
MNDPTKVVDVTAQLDKAVELQAKWGTAAGQAWEIGRHRLICGDCTNEATVGHLLGDGGPKLRMVWTDPPYGVDYAGKNAYLNRTDRGNRIQRPIENDGLTPEETGALFRAALAAAIPHCASGACCYATVPSGPLLVHFIQAFNASGFDFRHLLVWVKQHFVIGMADYHYRHEPILYGWLTDGAHYFGGDRSQDSVFEFDKPQINDLHPTCKPSELIAPMVANSSRAGDVIYDPFLGSGSTLVAAQQLGRVGRGVEILPEYVAVALERLSTLGLSRS